MVKSRLALAGGFDGNDGDGPSPLEKLMAAMIARGRSFKIHPIATLHQHERYFHSVCPFATEAMKVEASKRILAADGPSSIHQKSAASLLTVLDDYPEGYLAQAIEKLGIQDFGAWLDKKTIKPEIISPKFGEHSPA